MTAEEIVNSEVWKRTVEKLQGRLVEQWRIAPPDDLDGLVDLSQRQRALREVIQTLERELHKSINLQK